MSIFEASAKPSLKPKSLFKIWSTSLATYETTGSEVYS